MQIFIVTMHHHSVSTLFAILFESQSSPSYSPSPEVAHVLWMYLQRTTCINAHEDGWSEDGVGGGGFGLLLVLPVALSKRVKAKLISYFSSIHCIWKIWLVCKYKQYSIPQLILPAQQVVFGSRENHADVTNQIPM